MNCNSKMEISPKEPEYNHQEKNYGEYLSPIATDVNLLMYLRFTNSYFLIFSTVLLQYMFG